METEPREENTGGGMLTNTGAKARGGGGGDGGGERPQGRDWKHRSKGTDRAQSPPSPSPLSCSQPCLPQHKQDAVSMTTWPARKGGRGLQRKFSTSAGRGCDAEKEWAGYMGGGGAPHRALEPQNISPTASQDSHPAPRWRPPHPHLWAIAGEGEGSREAQGSNVQSSAAAQTSCVG